MSESCYPDKDNTRTESSVTHMKLKFLPNNELPKRVHQGKPRSSLESIVSRQLRDNPGQWASWPKPLTKQQPHSLAHKIKRGDHAAFPAGEFEVAVRARVLYLRYVGTEDSEQAQAS